MTCSESVAIEQIMGPTATSRSRFGLIEGLVALPCEKKIFRLLRPAFFSVVVRLLPGEDEGCLLAVFVARFPLKAIG